MKKILILGLSRTASKLYRTVLNRHEGVYILHEIVYDQKFKRNIAKIINENGGFSNENAFANSIEELYTNKFFHELAVEYPDQQKLLEKVNARKTSDWAGTLTAILEAKADILGKSVAGAKNPVHFSLTPKVLRELEDIKVLYLLRDPRAIYASEIPKKMVPNPTSNFPLLKIKFLQRLLILIHVSIEWSWAMIIYKRVKRNVLLCKYEHLVDEPEDLFKKIFTYCDLSFHPSYLSEVPVIQSSHKRNVNTGFNKAGKENWKNTLSFSERQWFKLLTFLFRYHSIS